VVLLQVIALNKRTASCLGFLDIVKLLLVASVPHHFDKQELQSLCFIVRVSCDAVQTLQHSTCNKVAIATVTTSCVSFHCCGRQLTPSVPSACQGRRNKSQAQPNAYKATSAKAKFASDRSTKGAQHSRQLLTVQAWQSNQIEINPVHCT